MTVNAVLPTEITSYSFDQAHFGRLSIGDTDVRINVKVVCSRIAVSDILDVFLGAELQIEIAPEGGILTQQEEANGDAAIKAEGVICSRVTIKESAASFTLRIPLTQIESIDTLQAYAGITGSLSAMRIGDARKEGEK